MKLPDERDLWVEVESDAYLPGKKVPLPEARFEHWRANELWTAHEFVFLLLGLEPVHRKDVVQTGPQARSPHPEERRLSGDVLKLFSPAFSSFYRDVLHLLDDSVRTKNLPAFNAYHEEFRPGEILAWAQAKGYPIREELQSLLPRKVESEIGPAAQKHPEEPYSDREEKKLLELVAALLCHIHDGPAIIKNLKGAKSSMFGRVHHNVMRWFPMDGNTLRKLLKRLPEPREVPGSSPEV